MSSLDTVYYARCSAVSAHTSPEVSLIQQLIEFPLRWEVGRGGGGGWGTQTGEQVLEHGNMPQLHSPL